MKKSIILSLIFLASCTNQVAKPTYYPLEPPTLQGKIITITTNPANQRVSLYVEAQGKFNNFPNVYERASVGINDQTQIFRRNTATMYEPMKPLDLSQGDTVVVYFIGAVGLSDPPSGIAIEVIVLK